MLNLYQLRIFVMVAETHSYSQAAQKLHLTQPAVSLQIHALEKNLNHIKLFERDSGRMELTEAGHALLEPARELLAQADQIEQMVLGLHGSISGKLTLGCCAEIGEYLLPRVIAMFRQTVPGVKIVLESCESAILLERLQQRRIDVGLSDGESPRGVTCQLLGHDELVALLPLDHALAKSERITLSQLAGEPLVLREAGSSLRRTLDAYFSASSIPTNQLQVVFEASSMEALQAAVEAGLGVAVISKLVARRFKGRIAMVRTEGGQGPLLRPINVLFHESRSQSPAQASFMEFLFRPKVIESIHKELAR
jgi:DNA-binding transcriptional LysR family regulator